TAMQFARTGATIVAAGLKDRLLDGPDVSQMPLRHLTIAPGGGLALAGACPMINEGKVPTGVLHGASFPLEQFEVALALAARRVPGQDAVRVSLKVA
ncbi:hypothetical protein, partial [Glutamicibacter sp. V16R2B1]|uniref:hypothetical protein n=1 Tax=Glutamicibacter sp. V16R2B1 TaxID=2036207 RepID=UPI00126C22E7